MMHPRKLLALLLCAVMLLSVLPMTAAAETSGLQNFKKVNTYNAGTFTDVSTTDWFSDNVKAAYEIGLMIGQGESFGVENNLTVAEAVTLAARLHSIYSGDNESFVPGSPWYQVYLNYVKSKNLVSLDGLDMTAPATRAQFARILAAALPSEALKGVNNVADDAIPDVKLDHDCAEAIYKLYRAGVLVGNDDQGTFAPNSNIKRSEVAAIVTRMADSGLRKAITLGEFYTVTFDLNYPTVIENQVVSVEAGKTVSAPLNPKRSGFLFTGWFSAATGGTQFNFSDLISGDTVLYAQWKVQSSGGGNTGGEFNPTGYFTVTFDSTGGSEVNSQRIKAGNLAEEPEDPEKDGNMFIGWYPERGFSFAFDFDTPINKNITLYAKWYNQEDLTDSDNDGVSDEMEREFGTDPYLNDTDSDSLSDFDELNWLNYNPLLDDTDENGILDKDEDPDDDGLSNYDESQIGTNMIVVDTDHDGLTDYEEARIYGTLPLNPDSDGDGVADGVEVSIGSDPLVVDTVFTTTVETSSVADGDRGGIGISVSMDTDAEGAGVLSISPVNNVDNPLVSMQIPGFLNSAYEISSDKDFISATITFTLGEDVGTIGDDFQPRIYYLNEESGLLEEVENQTVVNGQVKADVTHFSTYLLLNKVEFDAVWDEEIKPPFSSDTGDDDNTTLDIVFVIDYSASMDDNDHRQIFKELSKDFVSKLRDGKDKAAVVKFIRRATVVSGLTTDKDILNAAIDSISYDSGYGYYSGTDGSAGLNEALNILESSISEYQYVIFITDGEDNGFSYSYDSLIERAIANHVVVYTVGMGSASESVLRTIASQTNGKYYHATTAVSSENVIDLDEVFQEIESETVDLTTDSNDDGIPDYYVGLLNDGTLRLSNGTAWLVGVTDMYGDSADWDGDGLKNGQEITISTFKDGAVYVSMRSDPLLYDTDFDGYSDYEEVKLMHTSPKKITRPSPMESEVSLLSWSPEYSNFASVQLLSNSIPAAQLMAKTLNGELKNLMDDALFPEEYLDFSKEGHWMQYVFDWKKTDQAKSAIIDYFYTFTTEAELYRDDESAERLALIGNIKTGVDAVSSVVNAFKSVRECAITVGTLGYSESSIQGSVTKANKASETSNATIIKLLNAKKTDLENLNNWIKQKSPKVDSFLHISTSDEIKFVSKSTSAIKDIDDAISDVNEFADEVGKTDWDSIDLDAIVSVVGSGVINVASVVSTIADTVNIVAKVTKTAATAHKNVSQWPLLLRNHRDFSMRERAVSGKTTAGKAIGLGFTVVMDIVGTAGDVLDVLSTYGKIEANYAEYKKYMELLIYIENNDEAPDYLRNGAQAITIMFDSAGDPDWDKFDREVKLAAGKEIAVGVLTIAIDVLSYAFPVVKLGNTVYKAAKAAFTIAGVTQRAKTIVEAQAYYRITDGSREKLDEKITIRNGYFEYDDQDEETVLKYAVQLAQGRIVGLDSVMGYLSTGRIASFFDRGWFGNHKSKEDIINEYHAAIKEVYEVAKKSNLMLSSNLPLYSAYGK